MEPISQFPWTNDDTPKTRVVRCLGSQTSEPFQKVQPNFIKFK